MDRHDAVGIPLQFADQGAGLNRPLQFDDAAAVADDCLDRLAGGYEFDALLTMAVQHGGHEALAAQSAGPAGACGRAKLDFN